MRQLGEEGRTVLVSSHVLHEVERMAPRVVVLVNGRLVAEGDTRAIRDLLADRPRTHPRRSRRRRRGLAQALIGEDLVGAVRFDDGALSSRRRTWSASAAACRRCARRRRDAASASSPSATTSRASTRTSRSARADGAAE